MKRQIVNRSYFIVFIVLALLIGFALRINLIEKRPLHFDEGINVYFAPLSLPELLQAHITNADTDPPAHRIMLGLWSHGAGLSPFSIRLLSVFFSLLSVALTYRVARTLKLSQSAGVLAAVLMALSPYAIDYAQEAKGYAMGAAMALASWWGWMKHRMTNVERRMLITRHSSLVVYAVSTALMLSTHFYTAPVLLMQWVWWFATRDEFTRKAFVSRLLLQVIACVPVGLWALMALQSIVAGSIGMSGGTHPLPLLALAQLIFGEMSVSRAANESLNLIGAIAFGLATLFGAVMLWQTNRRAFWFGATLLVPLVFTAILQLHISFFKPRFLLYALPNVLVLISGLICDKVTRRQGDLTPSPPHPFSPSPLLLVPLSACLFGLSAFYQSPIDAANDFRPLIAQMRPLVKQDDSALGTYIWMRGMMTSYAPEAADKLRWHVDFVNEQNVSETMPPIVAEHSRLWSFNFARNPDAPQTTSVQWLRGHWAYADRFTAGNMSVLLFATAQDSVKDEAVIFDERIRLRWQINCIPNCAAQPGDVIPVIAEWTTLKPITDDLSISLQLMRPAGQLAAQNDSAAVNGLAPSFTWQPNQPVLDRRAVLIPSMLNAGRYTLRLGIYRRSDGARLKTETGADFVEVAGVEIR